MDSEEFREWPTQVNSPELVVNAELVSFYCDLAEVQPVCDRLLVAIDRRDAFAMCAAARRLCTVFLAANTAAYTARVPNVALEQQHEATLAFRGCQQTVLHVLVLACRVAGDLADPRLLLLLNRVCEFAGFFGVAIDSTKLMEEELS